LNPINKSKRLSWAPKYILCVIFLSYEGWQMNQSCLSSTRYTTGCHVALCSAELDQVLFERVNRLQLGSSTGSLHRTSCFDTVIVHPGESLNCSFFASTALERLNGRRAETRPNEKGTGTVLHIDNVRRHPTAPKFANLGTNRLSHPPYRQNLAPCNFWLFGYLENKL
jgi:hypothetical protein